MDNNRWWRGAVIYQIYPRSFLDTNGDGVGDLPGIIDRLDYVASLGVDAIWISPFFKSPMADFGYDIADYRDVDPLFGTLDDFDRLLAKAHALGLRVMIDQVLSHTSIEHDWFKESRDSRDNPKADWYVWADAQARRHAAQQLAVDLRRRGLAVGTAPRPVLPAQLPRLAAGPQLPQPGRARGDAGQREVLARPRRRRPAPGRDQLLLPRRAAARQPAQAGGTAHRPRLQRRTIRTRSSTTGTTTRSRRTCASSRTCARCSTAIPDATTLGEISSEDSLATMAEYVNDQRLHMGYSFELLTDDCSAAYIRGTVENARSDDDRTAGRAGRSPTTTSPAR